MQLIEMYQRQLGLEIRQWESVLKSILSQKLNHFSIQSRIKKESTLEEKMRIKGYVSIFQIRDVYAFRILVPTVQDAYTAYYELIKRFPCEYEDTKNYLIVYKPVIGHEGYGYQALQITLRHNNCCFEVQITTTCMHDLNEMMHEEYKYHKYRSWRSP